MWSTLPPLNSHRSNDPLSIPELEMMIPELENAADALT